MAIDWSQYEEKVPENKIDWSKYREDTNVNASSDQASLLRKIMEGLSGGAVGAAQGLSDIGANIAQFPGDIYSAISGKPGYKAPHPDIRGYAPSSPYGQTGEMIGEFASPLVSPGLALESALGKAMFGGKLLPRIALGAGTGAAQSENRALGAGLGALFPALGKVIRTPKTESSATKLLKKSRELAANEEPVNYNISNELFNDISNQFGSKTLAPTRSHIENLLTEALSGGHEPYFKLQSTLDSIARELKNPGQPGIKNFLFPPQTSAEERLTGEALQNLRQRLIKEMGSHYESQGLGHIPRMEEAGRKDFAAYKNFQKNRNKAALGLLGLSPVYPIAKHFL